MKTYLFTYDELTALRDAATEEYHRLKTNAPTEGRQNRLATLRALADQFRDDLRSSK